MRFVRLCSIQYVLYEGLGEMLYAAYNPMSFNDLRGILAADPVSFDLCAGPYGCEMQSLRIRLGSKSPCPR